MKRNYTPEQRKKWKVSWMARMAPDKRAMQSLRAIWRSMKHRCYKPNHISYIRYGALGITVCDRWLNSFENFYEDMGMRPYGCWIDRIDGRLGYSPENCRWITPYEQGRNKRTNAYIEYNGKRLIITDWAKELGLSPVTLRQRIDRGYPLHIAMSSEHIKCSSGKHRVQLKYKTK